MLAVFQYLDSQNYKSEVIVVDDGSTDKTNQIASDFQKNRYNLFLLRNEQNSQKGYSVKRGILYAKGKYILYSDADLSVQIKEIEKFYKWFDKGYDILLFRHSFHDTQCGFKCFKEKQLGYFLTSRRYLTSLLILKSSCWL